MKKFLNLLLVFVMAFSYAQLANFTITATKVSDETCPNNGAISWTTSGTTVGSTLTYSIVNAATNAVITSTSANSFIGLVAGTYKIVATQTLGSQSNQASSSNITIVNQKVTLTYTSTATNEWCGNDGTITVNVSAGKPPYTYQLLDNSNNVIVSQPSNVFTGLTAGSYKVRVIDQCGTGTASQVTVNKSTSYVSNYQMFGIYNDDCTVKLMIANGGGNSLKAPITAILQYTDPSTGQQITNTRTKLPSFSGGDSGFSLPNLDVALLPYSITLTDACGFSVKTDFVFKYEAAFSVSSQSLICGTKNLSFSSYQGFQMISGMKFTVAFTSSPTGFNPASFDSNYGQMATFHNFGDPNNPVPEGDYEYILTDQCGRIKKGKINVSYTPLVLRSLSGEMECNSNQGYISSAGFGERALINSIQVTSAPPEFINMYGALPYIIPTSAYDNAGGGGFVLNHLPPGTYSVTWNYCNNQTISATTTIQRRSYSTSGTLSTNCYGQMFIAGPTNTNYYVQKYFPEKGKWGTAAANNNLYTPGVGMDYSLFSGANAVAFFVAGNRWFNAPAGPGIYRIVENNGRYPYISNGNYIYYICDPLTSPSVSVGTPLSLDNVYAYQCANGTYDVAVFASGSAPPYSYAIVSDGTSSATIIKDNGTNPVFQGVAGGSYFFRVMDDCGNFITRKLDIAQLGKPGISIVSDCSTSPASLKLQVNGLDYLSYEWYNTANPSTILSTSPVLDLGPFDASKAGTYAVHMRSANSGSCINQTEIMTLTPTALTSAQAGTGQTVNLAYDGTTPSVDLFNYLTGPYDGYGTWAETTVPSSSLLTGHNWNVAAAAPGTYTFSYTVAPPCGGTPSSTTVTINLSKLCYRLPVTTGGTVKDTNFGITALQRAGAKDASQWPMVRKGGWMALEANGKGFVVNRVAFDSSNMPVGIPQANFVAGMMVYDTTNKCLKIYNGTVWSCYTTQTCPN